MANQIAPITLRYKPTTLTFAILVGVLVAFLGAYVCTLAFSNSSNPTWDLLEGVGAILLGLGFAFSQISWRLIAYPDRLEFRQFGLKRWSIPVSDIGVGEGPFGGPPSIVIMDSRKGKARTNLIIKSFDNDSLQAFSNHLDTMRANAGVQFDESEPTPEPSWADILTSTLGLPLLLLAVVLFNLGVDVWRRHLPLAEIIGRVERGLGVSIALFVVIGAAIWLLRFTEKRKTETAAAK